MTYIEERIGRRIAGAPHSSPEEGAVLTRRPRGVGPFTPCGLYLGRMESSTKTYLLVCRHLADARGLVIASITLTFRGTPG